MILVCRLSLPVSNTSYQFLGSCCIICWSSSNVLTHHLQRWLQQFDFCWRILDFYPLCDIHLIQHVHMHGSSNELAIGKTVCWQVHFFWSRCKCLGMWNFFRRMLHLSSVPASLFMSLCTAVRSNILIRSTNFMVWPVLLKNKCLFKSLFSN